MKRAIWKDNDTHDDTREHTHTHSSVCDLGGAVAVRLMKTLLG